MVDALSMGLHLRRPEVHLTQIPRRVALRFVIEMRGARVAALAARRHRDRAHAVPELDDSDEAVPARPIPLLRARIGSRAKRRERAPPRRREPNRNARPRVVERLDDITR